MDEKDFKRLFKAAAKARQNSYSPISGFKVGAAILTGTGHIYAGTNVEEAAFNLSIHSEQNAIGQMVAKEGWAPIKKLVVVGETIDGVICAPCGHCRQLCEEFNDAGIEIVVVNPEGVIQLETTLGEIFPHAFHLKHN